ncbi:hypothetical protein P7K49_031283 [Saguinus oedipus]|uniref:Uncharacterized protein n=1 Tax=Saguinus oedipus TaxID=9490 RepID=A0ABQ9TYY5_SAGOE|nr:hypothetical protein P7K49_031283 [Saguinus oedipus]
MGGKRNGRQSGDPGDMTEDFAETTHLTWTYTGQMMLDSWADHRLQWRVEGNGFLLAFPLPGTRESLECRQEGSR